MANRLRGEDADGPRAAEGFSMEMVQKLAVGGTLDEKTRALPASMEAFDAPDRD
jgi:hypothetical protein